MTSALQPTVLFMFFVLASAGAGDDTSTSSAEPGHVFEGDVASLIGQGTPQQGHGDPRVWRTGERGRRPSKPQRRVRGRIVHAIR